MFITALLVVTQAVTPTPADSRQVAIDLALPLLQKAAAGHIEQKTCFACHNQATPMLAFATARARGFDLEPETFSDQAEHILRFIGSNRERFTSGKGTGGQVDTAGYALFTLELAGHEPNEDTTAVVEYLLKTQAGRDHWNTTSDRPPTEASTFTSTYLALRALRHWPTKAQQERATKRIEAARAWLLKQKPKDTEDRVFRLFGLKEAGADPTAIAAAAWDLLRTQRPDGTWSQTESMEPDPYATATALVALHQAGGLAVDHPAYTRGVAFLVKSQKPDGSWYVKSRSKPFQPYYESGFPHGKDQFISAATSGWATTALLLTRPAK